MPREYEYQACEQKEIILSKNMKRLDLVSEDKFYRIRVQVGPNAAWAKVNGSGKVNLPPASLQAGEKNKRFEPVMVAKWVKPVPGSVVNGLIVKSNQWIDRNTQRELYGDLGSQICVTACEEVQYFPESLEALAGNIPMPILNAYIEKQAEAVVARIIASQSTKKQASLT